MAISEEMRKRVRKAIRSSYWYGKEATTERAIRSEEDEDYLVRSIEEIETYRVDAEATVADQRAELHALASKTARLQAAMNHINDATEYEGVHHSVALYWKVLQEAFALLNADDLLPLTPAPDAPREDGR